MYVHVLSRTKDGAGFESYMLLLWERIIGLWRTFRLDQLSHLNWCCHQQQCSAATVKTV